MEPNRCCITSIALVLLKTGIAQPDASPEENTAEYLDPSKPMPAPPQVNVNASQLATAQKLLLFWRKPAVSSGTVYSDPQPCWHLLTGIRRTAQMLVGRHGGRDYRNRRQNDQEQSPRPPHLDARVELHLVYLLQSSLGCMLLKLSLTYTRFAIHSACLPNQNVRVI